MSQSSIIIHKGGKEEKYEIYVEDYVLSFLKAETGTLELSEFFYGFKEKYGRKYTIYGVGRDRHLAVFEKYSLLEEIGCRLTQAGPVFMVREGAEHYEVKGYEVFYQDNTQMQAYLIERKQSNDEKKNNHPVWTGKNRAISVQLSIILVILIAIVINSTNSYDKMQQLNQPATEVFFAMENQEAERTGEAVGQGDIVAERDPDQAEDILKLAALETPKQTDVTEEETDKKKDRETGNDADSQETETNVSEIQETFENDEEAAAEEADSREETENNESTAQTTSEEPDQPDSVEKVSDEEELEALSRNVARYYKVERGDTLYTISQKIYGDTAHVQKICELNQIDDPDRIRYGQKIILP